MLPGLEPVLVFQNLPHLRQWFALDDVQLIAIMLSMGPVELHIVALRGAFTDVAGIQLYVTERYA